MRGIERTVEYVANRSLKRLVIVTLHANVMALRRSIHEDKKLAAARKGASAAPARKRA